MLEHLRQRVIQTLASTRSLTLSTFGPAGLQSSQLPCEASGMELFVLVPRTSDHLFNLETQPEVVVVHEAWNVQGRAQVILGAECPADLAFTHCPEVGWSEVVRIHPTRVNILRPESGSPAETIDVE